VHALALLMALPLILLHLSTTVRTDDQGVVKITTH
jgi:hypothetical protein